MKRGKQLLETIKGHSQRDCPVCKKSLGPVALVNIVYTFEPCNCPAAKFVHLVETLWHRDCFHRPVNATESRNG